MRPIRVVVAIAAALCTSAFAADQTKQPPRTQSVNEGSAHAQPRHAQSQPPELIRQVQQRLNSRGFDVGTVDGKWSLATQEGVKRFQAQQGMIPTGQLDETTLGALGLPAPSSSAGGSNPPPADRAGGGKLFE